MLAGALGGLVPPEDGQRFIRRERVFDVTKVDALDEPFGRHIDQELPQRLLLELRVQIPDRVHDRGRRQVHDALLRAEPANLRVGDEPAPESSEVCDHVLDGRADHVRHQGLDRRDADLRSAPDREGEAVPRDAGRMVGFERDVRRRVVRVGVHGVRAGAAERRRKTDVIRDSPHDPRRHSGGF